MGGYGWGVVLQPEGRHFDPSLPHADGEDAEHAPHRKKSAANICTVWMGEWQTVMLSALSAH